MKKIIAKWLVLFALVTNLGCSHAAAQIFSSLYHFNSDVGEGGEPVAGLILSGNTLYGTTVFGGTNRGGTVFAINTDGTGLTNLYNFICIGDTLTFYINYTNSGGAFPTAALVLSGNALYGTTMQGGLSGCGTIFAINTNGTDFTNIYIFSAGGTNSSGLYTNSDGENPCAGLILCSNRLYGTAGAGGSAGYGTVFAINTDGTDFTNLYTFTNGSDGANPIGGLVLSSNKLYGTSAEGYYSPSPFFRFMTVAGSGYGTVFAINTDGTDFTNLYTFTNGPDGIYPMGCLLLSGNTLFGTAESGGSYGEGTIFKINTDSTGFTNLYSFTAIGGPGVFNNDGGNPIGGLILSGNTLYGTASDGGYGDNGTIFAINTNGTGFTNLYSLYPTEGEGCQPFGDLLLSGNTLYETIEAGGLGNGFPASGGVVALSLGSIPLNIQNNSQNQVITWGNPAFSLQTAPALTGPWTTLSNISPYMITVTNVQQFFQLVHTNSP